MATRSSGVNPPAANLQSTATDQVFPSYQFRTATSQEQHLPQAHHQSRPAPGSSVVDLCPLQTSSAWPPPAASGTRLGSDRHWRSPPLYCNQHVSPPCGPTLFSQGQVGHITGPPSAVGSHVHPAHHSARGQPSSESGSLWQTMCDTRHKVSTVALLGILDIWDMTHCHRVTGSQGFKGT